MANKYKLKANYEGDIFHNRHGGKNQMTMVIYSADDKIIISNPSGK